MQITTTLAAAAVLTAGLTALAMGAYLVLLAAAAGRRQTPAAPADRGRTVAVLIPAHNEEQLVGRAAASLLNQDLAAARRRVIVIADNCHDRTAHVATAAGAEVWVRDDGATRGKGRSLRWAMDRLLAELQPPGAVAVVDADSVAAPDLLRRLVGALDAGHDAVQADYRVLEETGSERERLVAAAFLLFHRVRLGGRARLGLPAALVGNGMAFSTGLLRRRRWESFSGVEDLEETVALRLAGVRVAFVEGAIVRGPVASGAGAQGQRLRWEGGRWHVVRRAVPKLLASAVRRRDVGLLDAAFDLAVPPLGLLLATAMLGAALAAGLAATGVVPLTVALPWLLAVVAVAAYVPLGLISAGAPPESYVALLRAPAFLAAKLPVYARAALAFDPARFDRTLRAGEPLTDTRVMIGGVPIDAVDEAGALRRIDRAFEAGSLLQVATVNLDFLVQAGADATNRRLLRACELNVADGWPVVWLGRLLGAKLSGRVTGHDLVPGAVRVAAARGAGVFLLGAQDGVAETAAAELAARNPGLQAHFYEPPGVALEKMDDEAILSRIDASGAKLLLVAFGHPKQERWIARNRERLPVAVAIGVGCTLDVIAGRVGRAPRWMQRLGLEWLFRLQQEPGRLFRRYLADALWLFRVVPATVLAARVGAERQTG